ncbi:hypothetical protein GF366_03015 [Candidatus Peregrinibacteria bacterium]|nr:hypothetical protein [Candidatus Peregrinibacteria bacterium]
MAEEETIGPPKISFPTFLLKILAALAGGIIGAVILLVIFFLASSLLTPLTSADEYISPIFIFILMMMIFIASTVGNLLSTFLLSLTESEKYKRISSTIYQVFIISLIIFILMVPVYFITATINIGIVAYAVALHIIISAQVSALILEIVSNYKYSLVGVYGVTFSVLLSAGIMFGMASIVESPTILLFAALPVVWGSIGFIGSIVSMVYGWIARIYDKDFLSTQTLYGADYDKEVEVSEEPKAEDEEGAEFLRKNR